MWPENNARTVENVTDSRWEFGLVLLWLSTLFLWTLSPLAGYDFWFYLAAGRDILSNHTIVISESYLGTTSKQGFGNYGDTAWLGNVLCYLVYGLLGLSGLAMFKSLLLTLSTGAVYLGNRLSGLSPFWAGAWATLALWTIRGRFEMRSYLFTTLALALLSLLLLKLEQDLSFRRGALALLGLFFVWSNTHQGIIAGFLMLGSWLFFGRRTAKERILLTMAASVASLFRPNISSQLDFYRDTFSNSQAMRGVVEWGAPSWEQRATHLGLFYIVLFLVSVYTLYRVSKRLPLPPLAFGLNSIAFSIAGWRSYRSMAELLPIVCPMAAPYFPRIKTQRSWRVITALVLSVLLLQSFSTRNLNRLNEASGYPSALVPLIPKQGQVFNSFEFGNYLVFEGVRPFIHGMTALYKEQLVIDFEGVLNPTPRRVNLLEEYQVTSALLHFPTDDDATSNFVDYLSASPHWALKAWDDSGLLFVKESKETGLSAVQPWSSPAWTDPVAAEKELRNLIAEHPSALAHVLLSRILLARGDLAEATQQATFATQLHPTSAAGWTQLGGCYAKGKNLTGMLIATEEAIELAPSNPLVQLNRSLALYSQAQLSGGLSSSFHLWQARRLARQAISTDPALRPALKVVLQDQGES